MVSWNEAADRQESRKIYLATVEVARKTGNVTEREILRFATEPFISDGNVFWEPRLKGVPYFTRRVQEIFLGTAQVGFGSLELINTDGGLDSRIQDWSFAGCKTEILVGFDGVPYGQFRKVFSGRTGTPTWDDRKINVSIWDDRSLLFRAKMPEGTYHTSIASVVQTALTAAGITTRNEDDWALWSSQNNFNVWLKTTGNEDVGQVLDRLLGGLLNWWGFPRNGPFHLGTYTLASESDEPLLEFKDDMEIFDFSCKNVDMHHWKMGIEYYTDVSGSTPVKGVVSRSDTSIKGFDPTAREGTPRSTALTSQTDANTVLDRWWNVYGVPRKLITIRAKVKPFSVGLFSTVRLTRPRFGIDKNFRVVGLEEDHTKNQIKLELFG